MQPLLFLFLVSLIQGGMAKGGRGTWLLHHVLHTALIELTVLGHSLSLPQLSLQLIPSEGIANVKGLIFALVTLEIWKEIDQGELFRL